MTKVTWLGQSGTSYTFEVYPVGTQFNNVSGLYIFCSAGPSSTWHAQYVGQTESFADRLNACRQQHHAWPLAQQHGATYIGVRVMNGIGGKQARLNAETDLRRKLNPPANRQAA